MDGSSRFHCCKTIRVLSNPESKHGRANRADTRRDHPGVGVDKREDSRAVIERARDDGRQVVLGGNGAKTAADVRHFTRCQ